MLLGDGDPAAPPIGDKLAQEVSGFLLANPTPDPTAVAGFLRLYSSRDRQDAARALIAAGVSDHAVANAMRFLDAADRWDFKTLEAIGLLASAGAAAIHGYRRNQSIGWALGWFCAAMIFPVATLALAVGQGFAKPKAG
jgi:hypothetical protein